MIKNLTINYDKKDTHKISINNNSDDIDEDFKDDNINENKDYFQYQLKTRMEIPKNNVKKKSGDEINDNNLV